MSEIAIDLDDDQTRKLWAAVGDLVERLPGQWVLIGGLMVQLSGLSLLDSETMRRAQLAYRLLVRPP
jgi:hypothetical protein